MQINVVSINPLLERQKERLRSLGELKYYDTFFGDPELISKLQGAEILMITMRLSIDILEHLDKCKLIAAQATGYDAINIQKVSEMGIKVCNVPDYCSDSVVEHIFGLILNLSRKLFLGDKMMRENNWKKGLAYTSLPISGKTLGIFGFGKIGQKAAKIAKAFGANVIAVTENPNKEREEKFGVKFVDFDQLLKESDFLILAAPATNQTKGIFGKNEFTEMKKNLIFINTARGVLVDENALSEALNNDLIAGAGIDVFTKEPPVNDPLLTAKNCILTPHVAWSSEDAVERMNDICIDNIEAFIKGNPQNIVN
jgi:lactate dehydrogenase-like 2-hydroxyacid dehydrogenase